MYFNKIYLHVLRKAKRQLRTKTLEIILITKYNFHCFTFISNFVIILTERFNVKWIGPKLYIDVISIYKCEVLNIIFPKTEIGQ